MFPTSPPPHFIPVGTWMVHFQGSKSLFKHTRIGLNFIISNIRRSLKQSRRLAQDDEDFFHQISRVASGCPYSQRYFHLKGSVALIKWLQLGFWGSRLFFSKGISLGTKKPFDWESHPRKLSFTVKMGSCEERMKSLLCFPVLDGPFF